MALSRTAGLFRLALRTPWAATRLLSSAAGGEPLSGEPKRRRVDLEALRRERALRPPSDRVAPALPSRYKQPYATREQLQLNKDIQACASGEAVLALVSSRLAVMNEVNAATALITISRRVSKDEAAWLRDDPRFAQLLRVAEAGFKKMVVRALSNSIYACGQLGISPPADWVQRFWLACALKFDDFNPQDLSNTLYACGQLGISPPGDWMKRYWEASAAKLGEFTEQGLSNTMYACGQLGIVPVSHWQASFWHASAAALGVFKPQALSNTIYACGQLGVMPPASWLARFWEECASKLGEFSPQHVGNMCFSVGQLGITPPADVLQRFWRVSADKMVIFKSQELTNCVFAFARLDAKPPAYWVEQYARVSERLLPYMKEQDLANSALALATLALWELPLWPLLWARLCSSLPRDTAGWSAENRLQARQLYQVHQAATMERPGLPEPEPELLAAVRKCWVNQARGEQESRSSSRLHQEVSACLTQMGVAHVNERWCERAERLIDIAIEGASAPVALEVDGPYHFLQDGRQDGSTLLRNRMLAAHGWRVVKVGFREWQHELRTGEEREEYLRRLLASQ